MTAGQLAKISKNDVVTVLRIFSLVWLCIVAKPIVAQESVGIPIELDADGHVLVSAYVNGKGPFTFVLDSGGGGSHMISASVAAQAEVSLGKPSTGQTGSGSIQMWDGGEQKLSFVNSMGQQAQFFIEQYTFGEPPVAGQPELAGTIGTPLFDQFVVELDFANLQMVLHDPKSWTRPAQTFEVKLHFGWFSKVPRVALNINGRKTKLLLDTGAFAAAVLPPKASAKFGLAATTISGRITTGAENLTTRNMVADTVDWAGRSFAGVPLVVAEGFSGDGVLGMGLLACHHLWISYPKKKMYLGEESTNALCTAGKPVD